MHQQLIKIENCKLTSSLKLLVYSWPKVFANVDGFLNLLMKNFWNVSFLPTQTGFCGSTVSEPATNPVAHSHLYDPLVLLQTVLAPQTSGVRHSSTSTYLRNV